MLHELRIALLIFGIYAAVQPGMIFFGLSQKLTAFMDQVFGEKWGSILRKPLTGCVICMSSFWTLVVSIILDIDYVFTYDFIWDYILTVPTVAGMLFVLCRALTLIQNSNE